jgi:PQQ enzyme repeat
MKRARGWSLSASMAMFMAVGGICGTTFAALAGSDSEIAAASKNPDLWPGMGQNLALNRHSDLKQIDTDTVSKLQLIWSQSTGALRGHEGQPIVIDIDGKPMMFFVSAWPNIVQALDLSDPDNPVQVWNYQKKTDRDLSAVPRACCDTVNRGLNYADGKIVFATLDGFVIALDAKTGREAWVVKHAWPEHGETVTSAPLIADDKVIAGFGGRAAAWWRMISKRERKSGGARATAPIRKCASHPTRTKRIRSTVPTATISASAAIQATNGNAAVGRPGPGTAMTLSLSWFMLRPATLVTGVPPHVAARRPMTNATVANGTTNGR